jgi:hypothetical protein
MQQFHKFIYLTFMCHSTCFGRLHAHHQESTTALTASGFTLERGGSSIVGRGLADHLNAELNLICHLLALLGALHILHVSRIRLNGWAVADNLL